MAEHLAVSLPCGYGAVTADFPVGCTRILATRSWSVPRTDHEALVAGALAQPVAGPRLCELSRGLDHVVVITSDHTRALPSRVTLPLLFAEARRFQPDLRITLLVGTGLHRSPSREEIEERFGPEILSACHLEVHDAGSDANLVDLGTLSTGTHLLVNRLVAEADLVVAEGLIEPHFFAGYSGGRKSVLPATAGTESIYRNHRAECIDHPRARNGVLDGNPIHEEALEAARRTPLRFILNVVIDATKHIVAAVAGDPEAAHQAGVEQVAAHATCPAPPADIVVVSNFGYPLDRDLYQCVKGLSVASDAAVPQATIVLAAECRDGIGHSDFSRLASAPGGPTQILKMIRTGAAPARDAWQVQILARVLEQHRVIVTSLRLDPRDLRAMHMEWAPDLPTALAMARARHGTGAQINVIPEGPATIVVPEL